MKHLTAFFLLLTFSICHAQTNLIKNGDFEKGLENWKGKASISTNDHVSGNSSLVITSDKPTWVIIEQIIEIPNDTKFIEISGSLKAQDIVQGEQSWNKGMIFANFISEGEGTTNKNQIIGTVSGTTDWTAITKKVAVPDGVKKINVKLALNNCKGTLLVDNVDLKAFSE